MLGSPKLSRFGFKKARRPPSRGPRGPRGRLGFLRPPFGSFKWHRWNRRSMKTQLMGMGGYRTSSGAVLRLEILSLKIALRWFLKSGPWDPLNLPCFFNDTILYGRDMNPIPLKQPHPLQEWSQECVLVSYIQPGFWGVFDMNWGNHRSSLAIINQYELSLTIIDRW